MGSAIQSLASSLAQYITSPSDGVRIFSALNNFNPTNNLPSSAIGADQLEIQNSINDICRLSAATALAQFSSTYQPSSQQDAENVRNQVCDILDAEILIAGDEGQDDLFYSLTDLRNSVAQDLTTRGAALPPLQTFTTNIPMPSLVLAYQYYQDITRTDQLVASANPIHPAFMPVSFQALSS
jgi:prophage DNA circulation protein